MSNIINKKCIPCEGGVPPLTDDKICELLKQISGWQIKKTAQDGQTFKTLQKNFKFKDFRAAMSFLRQIEELAEAEGHHPDFCVHYNKVDFTLYTHAIFGLHENDFILAAKIDQIKK